MYCACQARLAQRITCFRGRYYAVPRPQQLLTRIDETVSRPAENCRGCAVARCPRLCRHASHCHRFGSKQAWNSSHRGLAGRQNSHTNIQPSIVGCDMALAVFDQLEGRRQLNHDDGHCHRRTGQNQRTSHRAAHHRRTVSSTLS